MFGSKDWNIKEWFKYFAVILVFFVVAIVGIIRLSTVLGRGLQGREEENINQDVKTYAELEIVIRDATLEYVNSNYGEEVGFETITIPLSNLVVNGLIEYPVDLKDKSECNGYSLVKLNGREEIVIEPFLKCSNYQTSGYQEWRLN